MVEAITIQLIATGITAISAIFAAIAASLSYLSIKTNVDTAKSQVLLQCLREYIEIRNHRTKALTEKKKELCEDYYRELFDLHWTEFRLWRWGYIDDETMSLWLSLRFRNYRDDSLIIKNENEVDIKTTYKECWDKLIESNYFEKDDPFTKFMNLVHIEQIKEAIKMKKEIEK